VPRGLFLFFSTCSSVARSQCRDNGSNYHNDVINNNYYAAAAAAAAADDDDDNDDGD